MGRGLRIGHPVAGTDPHPLYTSFDRNLMPFHVAAGGWGIQVPLQAPTPPTITESDVTVTSSQTITNPPAGTRYVIGASFTGPLTFQNVVTDIELVVPDTYNIGKLTVDGTVDRFRVRGSTIGALSSGVITQVEFTKGLSSQFELNDIIMDGVRVRSSIQEYEHAILLPNSGGGVANRFLLANSLVHSARASIFGEAAHALIANTSIKSGTYSSGQVTGGASGSWTWSIRLGAYGPIAIVDCDIRGRRFHRFRSGTSGEDLPGRLHYIRNTRMVAEQEGKFSQTGIISGTYVYNGGWVVNCDYRGYGGTTVDWERSIYGRITGTTFYHDDIDDAFFAGRESAVASFFATPPFDTYSPDHSYRVGNTYNAWERPSSWLGAGDPTTIALEGGSILNSTLHDEDMAGLLP